MASNPSVGRIVHYVLPDSSPHGGDHRPAIVTQVWQPLSHESEPGMSNITVFSGQSNDFGRGADANVAGITSDRETGSVRVGSVLYSQDPKPGTWHWPEYVP